MPVLETIYLWPTMPIVIEYGESPASNPLVPEDEDNIVATLKQSNCVNSISLTITKSFLEKLSALERPFLELDDLVLLCVDDILLTLSSAFQWGPRLHNLHLSRVAIPTIPEILFLSTGLVDLQLHEIFNVGLSPEAFANALSQMPQLQRLLLHFLSSTHYLAPVGLPLPREHITLLALRKLKYQGISKYLGNLAARINAPRLGNIDITFFNHPPHIDSSQLGQFINWIAMQKSHH